MTAKFMIVVAVGLKVTNTKQSPNKNFGPPCTHHQIKILFGNDLNSCERKVHLGLFFDIYKRSKLRQFRLKRNIKGELFGNIFFLGKSDEKGLNLSLKNLFMNV